MAEPAEPEEKRDVVRSDVDWEAIESWPEFRELTTRRRSFVFPATIFFLVYYMVFVILCGYAPDFMGTKAFAGVTIGYLLALTQFAMVAILGLWYLKKAEREFDPLSQAVIDRAESGEAAK